jgi:hypothetical protein
MNNGDDVASQIVNAFYTSGLLIDVFAAIMSIGAARWFEMLTQEEEDYLQKCWLDAERGINQPVEHPSCVAGNRNGGSRSVAGVDLFGFRADGMCLGRSTTSGESHRIGHFLHWHGFCCPIRTRAQSDECAFHRKTEASWMKSTSSVLGDPVCTG